MQFIDVTAVTVQSPWAYGSNDLEVAIQVSTASDGRRRLMMEEEVADTHNRLRLHEFDGIMQRMGVYGHQVRSERNPKHSARALRRFVDELLQAHRILDASLAFVQSAIGAPSAARMNGTLEPRVEWASPLTGRRLQQLDQDKLDLLVAYVQAIEINTNSIATTAGQPMLDTIHDSNAKHDGTEDKFKDLITAFQQVPQAVLMCSHFFLVQLPLMLFAANAAPPSPLSCHYLI